MIEPSNRHPITLTSVEENMAPKSKTKKKKTAESATVRICFRGLYVLTELGEGTCLIMPNAEGGPGAVHLDGRPAEPHWAWLRVRRGKEIIERIPLLGMDISFDGVDHGTSVAGVRHQDVIHLDQFVENLALVHHDPADSQFVCCRIRLAGGNMEASQHAQLQDWHVPNTLKPGSNACFKRAASEITWDTTVPGPVSVKLALPGTNYSRTVSLEPGHEITFGNLCYRRPENWPEKDRTPITGPYVVDHDFKWTYQLFEPSQAGVTWDDLLAGRDLPVPFARVPASRIGIMWGGEATCGGTRFDG